MIRSNVARLLLLTLVITLLAGLLPLEETEPVAAAPAAQIGGGDEVIVVLEDGADPVAVARELGVTPTYIYSHVFTGFAARWPATVSVASAQRELPIRIVSPDVPIEATAQVVPTGVRRIVAQDAWPPASGSQVLVNADVAVLDSGIQKRQAPPKLSKAQKKKLTKKQKRRQRKREKRQNRVARDLNVQGSRTCIGKGKATEDAFGHGTHVAGTIGARDNTYGAVGVAPGARLHAVRVLNAEGSGSAGSVICGLDWVYQHRATIDVVNMSLGGPGGPSDCNDNGFHLAVCRVVDAGIPVVVAAGNSGRDAGGFVPANFEEVITVSAMADTNGLPGGGGPNCDRNQDDTFANFSNFGSVVDIAAPGVCIVSTRTRGGTIIFSGTSMSTPHVTGAVALYKAANPGASVNDVRNWLLNEASVPQNSPDGFSGGRSNEPMLWLEGVSP